MLRTRSEEATRASDSNLASMTDALACDPEDPPDDSPDADPATAPDAELAAARIRARGESVRRRELSEALATLESRGELSEAERAAVARLSARLTDALVERWASTVADGRAGPATALELLEP